MGLINRLLGREAEIRVSTDNGIEVEHDEVPENLRKEGIVRMAYFSELAGKYLSKYKEAGADRASVEYKGVAFIFEK